MSGLILYSTYFTVSVLFLVVSSYVYTKITSYDELELISSGNTASAITLSGFMIGVSLPVASTIFHSVSITDMLLWCAAAFVFQTIAYFLVSKIVFKSFNDGIQSNLNSFAIALAGFNIALGLINAACIS